MSPTKKTKLGRDPFNGKKKGARRKRTSPFTAHKAAKAQRGRGKPGVVGLIRELTYYWIPRVRACAYVRVVKLASKFA
jgi:hypothetical protein